jgi:hypothetical protein
VFDSNSAPNDMFKLFQNYTRISVTDKLNLAPIVLLNTQFLSAYFRLNDLLWQEGFLIDFVQKKSFDKFLKKFLIFSAYTFSERYVFDKVTKFYIDLISWFSTKQSIYEFNNISNTLMIVVGLISTLILTVSFLSVANMYFFFKPF